MRIAIASGKGGTGKTTVATNLAYVAALDGHSVAYLDCDVEEPDGAIFLKPRIEHSRTVGSPVPQVDPDQCTGCGDCGRICQYSAILCLGGTVLTFPELCHGCGGCGLVCPAGAISETQQEMGLLEIGRAGGVRFVRGVLKVGQARSTPLIRAVKAAAPLADLVLADCPPGTSCPVIEAMRGSDYVLLVTEPTPFGLHDLKLAAATVRKLGMPLGVAINRAGEGDSAVQSFCDQGGIEVLARIADDRAVAEAYSRGELAAEAPGTPGLRETFRRLLDRLLEAGRRP